MQRILLTVITLLFTFFTAPISFADSLVVGSQTLEGTVLRTNGNDILLLMSDGILLCPRTNIESITLAAPKATPSHTKEGLPSFQTALLALNRQTWASNLKQIPATVIDAGPMKNVPYVSFRCAEDYEINIYGDLEQPAAIEAGVYGRLAKDELAKSRCEEFLHSLFLNPTHKARLRGLDWKEDLKTAEGMTFEVTPPTAPDAYGGWWMSVYSLSQLDASRASASELKEITTATPAVTGNEEDSSWTRDDFKMARKTRPTRITFRNAFGSMITNAEIVRVNEGVSLDWKDALGSGTVRLAELPDDLRALFNYDPDKDTAESERRARISAQQRSLQAKFDANAPPLPARATPDSGYGMGYGVPRSGNFSGGSSSYYPGGTVYVRGYTRSDGTYVRSHTRSSPRRR
jgi:hypothetical protein